MTETDIKNNNYWVQLTSTLHNEVDVLYNVSYSDDGDIPKDAMKLDDKQLQPLLNIISEAISAVEGSDKVVTVTVDKVKQEHYKK